MSNEQDDGGPAFPNNDATHPGMSLRDWFAGQALAGLCAYNEIADPSVYALACYALSDAMLAERGAK